MRHDAMTNSIEIDKNQTWFKNSKLAWSCVHLSI